MRLELAYNPEYVASLSLDHCEGLLIHVANHVLFGHLLMGPESFPNAEALLVAQEVTSNEWVPRELLAPESITLADHPFLAENEDTSTRYDILQSRMTSLGTRSANVSLDDHDSWAGLEQTQTRLAVTADVAAALQELKPEERVRLTETERAAINERLGAGALSLNDEEALGVRRGEVDWRRALRRFARSLRQRESSYARPPRRVPHLVGIVPGSYPVATKSNLVVAIDTSASMATEQLALIAGELEVMARIAEIYVVECDTEIQAHYRFDGHFRLAHGRGGTDLRPPFSVAHARRADGLVYFTDGDGPAPRRPPQFRVLWCLTREGKRPMSWGSLTRMQNI